MKSLQENSRNVELCLVCILSCICHHKDSGTVLGYYKGLIIELLPVDAPTNIPLEDE